MVLFYIFVFLVPEFVARLWNEVFSMFGKQERQDQTWGIDYWRDKAKVVIFPDLCM